MIVKAGSTDVTTYFHLRLAASGLDATGLTIANIDLTYVRTLEEPAAKVDAQALADQDTAHTDNFAIEIDATNMPGVYRVDWPDAAFAANAREVILTVKVATAFTESLRVELTPVAADLTLVAGTAVTAAAGIPEVKVASIANDAITASAIAANAIGASEIANGAIDAATFAAGAIDAAALAADASTEINAAVLAILGTPAGASMSADIAAIEAQTDDIGAAGAGLTAITGVLGSPAGASLAADIAAIEAQTDDFTAAQAEPTAVPAANATPLAKIAFLAALARNRIEQTATTNTLMADDGVTPIAAAAVSDDGVTAVRGEFA